MTTPREQLARMLAQHQLGQPGGGTATVATIACSCGWKTEVHSDRDWAVHHGRRHVADAIIAAGWQPPIPDRLNVVAEN